MFCSDFCFLWINCKSAPAADCAPIHAEWAPFFKPFKILSVFNVFFKNKINDFFLFLYFRLKVILNVHWGDSWLKFVSYCISHLLNNTGPG